MRAGFLLYLSLSKQLKRFYSSSNLTANVVKKLKNPDLVQTKGYIGGEWREGKDQVNFGVFNPALGSSDGAKLSEVCSMSSEDYDEAVEIAHESFESFRKTSGRERSELLQNLHGLIKENQDDLATLIVLENGKPFADAWGEILYSNSFFQWFAEEAPRIQGHLFSSAIPNSRIVTMRQPIGVCAIMTPWNFPTAMITRKLGAALAAGCTAVVKPASETPLSALALAHLVEKAGFPKGVVNVLPSADAASVGKLLCEHPLVKKVSFTGSTGVGKLLMSQSSSTLKKLSLELGGNAPCIIFDDADIDKAVDGAIASKFRSSGQTCVCANRLFVQESVYDEFQHKFVSKLKEVVKLGNGLDKGVTHGPLIHEKSMKKVRSHIEDAVSKGAEVLLGGSKRSDLGENFHDLTVLGNVTSDMKIFSEETFGPIAPLIKFDSLDDALRQANNTEVGLAGYFFSRDVNKIFKVAEELQVGMIGANTGLISEAALPFGGVKESGFGREGSIYGIDDYTIIKSVVVGGLDPFTL